MPRARTARRPRCGCRITAISAINYASGFLRYLTCLITIAGNIDAKQRVARTYAIPNDIMLNIVLFEPEIPPNTGNIMRLAANTGFHLHLIEPLGFELDDKQLRRAGLDYREWAHTRCYGNYEEFLDSLEFNRLYAFTTRAQRVYSDVRFAPGDALLFGPESRGLPAAVLDSLPGDQRLRIPMTRSSRSLNLSNTVSIAVYEAWRQLGFGGT